MANAPYPEYLKPFPHPIGDPPPWLLEVVPLIEQLRLAAIELEYQLEVEKAQVLTSTASKVRVERKLEIYNDLLGAQAEQAK